MADNSRRHQQYKAPSHLAWNHKQDGLLGEVFDMQHLREQQKQFMKYI